MNTPAHLVANLLVLGRGRSAQSAGPIVAGALLPDLPMVVFYGVERLVRAQPERIVWTVSYFDPRWQDFFDAFHSLPLIAALALAGWIAASRPTVLLAASMALHVALDLPLHHDDAHRHLFPFSDWRFESPVSYWDPAHFGAITGPLEALLVLGGCALLWRRYPGARARAGIAGIAALYLAYGAFALVFWLNPTG